VTLDDEAGLLFIKFSYPMSVLLFLNPINCDLELIGLGFYGYTYYEFY